jgi:hypothetical protein
LYAQPAKVRILDRVLHSTEKGISAYNPEKENIIISLTTHKKRIFDVPLVIESLFEQTRKPNKIVLWLSDNEFNDSNIPLILKKQQERGLDINYCKNIKSYKKLIPSLKKYPNDIIITVDDDFIYPYDIIENLYSAYKKNPSNIYCYRCHKMIFGKDGKLKPYNKWIINYSNYESDLSIFPTGCAGCLYPPHILNEEVFNESVFLKIAPHADDVWFKAMSLMNNVKCQKVLYDTKMIPLYNNQNIALEIKNVHNKQNDVQIKQVFDYYKLWDKLC